MMNFLMVQSLNPLIVITLFFTINLPFILCAIDPQYANCSQAINCGNIPDISYPFWGVNRANYCGLSGFKVECHDGIPMINMKGINYRVLEMSSSTRAPSSTVKVARQDIWETLCPPSSVINMTINFSLYTYGSVTRNVSLFYNCDTARLADLDFNIITENCSNSDANVTIFIGALKDTSNEVLDELTSQGLCERKVLVPVSERATLALQSRSTTFRDAINEDFELALRIEKGPCTSCESSDGNCGTNFTDGRFTCFCKDGPYAATRCRGEPSGSSTLPAGTVTGISVGVAATIIVAVYALYMSRKRIVFFKKFMVDNLDIEKFITDYGSLTPERYSYSKVKRMTNTFKEMIGKGGYGTVYKGILSDGLVVAVKVLSESKGNGEEFINEVASIGRTSHVNIVTLLGFCYERDKRALIYEYMPNGSLDYFIQKQGSDHANCLLDWKTLYEITVGVARGLEYLHRGCNTRILHFDIKPQNILLDKDFCPKVSDFGLAKLCKTKESIVSMMGMRGTAGYIAPEVFSRNFGGVSHKSDVYSYGMLVLEMVGARKNLDSGVSHTSEMFPHYIYKELELENEGNILKDMAEEESELVRKMILISLGCIQTNPSDRPSMSKVVEMLEGPLHSIKIPPKPYLYPTIIFADESISSQPSVEV